MTRVKGHRVHQRIQFAGQGMHFANAGILRSFHTRQTYPGRLVAARRREAKETSVAP